MVANEFVSHYEDMRTLTGGFNPRFFAKAAGSVAGGWIHDEHGYNNLLSNTGWNIYVGINPCIAPPNVKARDSDIFAAHNILIDIDPVGGFSEPNKAIFNTGESLKKLLGKGAFYCSHLVASGRGFQIWLPVEPTEFDEDFTEARWTRCVREVLSHLSCGDTGCRVDTSCSDLSRVARAPGSINQKTGRKASLVSKGDGSRLGVGSILVFDPGEPEEVSQAPNTSKLSDVVSYLTLKAVKFLTEGETEPGRHAAAFAAAASLRDQGVPVENALAWVTRGGSLCDPILSPSECSRATHNAYQRNK